ncbi:MAG: hypothetical protein HC927_04045 [Deltaproteobacteria bacterium]|nr:hypothetical protein [Deltaproteobacteria bacterium]
MARHTAGGWQDLTAEHLLELTRTEFEEFCESLVTSEAYDRHEGPEVDGRAGESIPDGGRDVLLSVTNQPFEAKATYQRKWHISPLTEDPLADNQGTRIVYSCKSGKDWLDLALDDARDGGARAIEVLGEGGYFKLMTNQRALLDAKVKRNGEKQTPHEHLRKAFWARLQQNDPNAGDPGPRIRIIEAGAIAAYLRARQPEGGDVERWLRRLRLVPVLRSLAEWRVAHFLDRQESWLVDDAERLRRRGELLEWLRSPPEREAERITCIVGKPGVGKTRLTLEALASDPVVGQRVRVALSPREAVEAIEKADLLGRHRDLVLIIDDCLIAELRHVVVTFRARLSSESRAWLVLLIPASLDAVRDELVVDRVLSLEPLVLERARELVANEIGDEATNEEIGAIARFSEGYPWFARLLAIEFRQAGRAPKDLREAVRWALAGEREVSSPVELDALRLVRARALLAASLTSSLDWDAFDPDRRRRLAHAVGLNSWQELKDTALQCEKRGLLRRSLEWRFKYVTPQVLEREVIAWLLGPDGPDGGARTLTEHGADYLGTLFETIARLGLADRELIACIAEVALQDLYTTELLELGTRHLIGPRLRFLAHHRPVATARRLRQLIEGTSLDDLQAGRDYRRSLVGALQAVSRDGEALVDGEAGLFRLARAENESYANNATRSWAGLFFVEMNSTKGSLHMRVKMLQRRLQDDSPSARVVALTGVESVLTEYPMRFSLAEIGSGLLPTPDEARVGRLRAWSMLCERFADGEITVAQAAKKLAIMHVRAALHLGIGQEVMGEIAAMVEFLSLDERIQLRDKLQEIRAYDARFLGSTEAQLERLEAAIAPRSFSERLRQHVAVWSPAALSEREVERSLDDALAQEGVEGDVPLRSELAWLATSHAQRAHVFAYAIGRRDVDGIMCDDLRRLVHEHPRSWQAHALLARYIGGMASMNRARAEALLRELQEIATEASAAALALVELGATPERLHWLEESLHVGSIQPFAIEELGRRNQWLEDAQEADFLHLINVMAAGSLVECEAALGLVVSRYRDRIADAKLWDSLELALARLAPTTMRGTTEHRWELGAKLLVDAGRAARVAELAVTALSRPAGSNDFARNALHRAVERDPSGAFWAVAKELEAPEIGGRLQIALSFHRSGFPWPTSDVLDWVGEDERRGRAAAAIVRVHSDTLPEPLRELIRRFGAQSSVAREIMARIESTDGIVASLAEHDVKQLDRARRWLGDPDPEVAAFAEQLVESLERSHAWHAASEEHERHRYGT